LLHEGPAIAILISVSLATIAVAGRERALDQAQWHGTLVETGHTLESPATIKLSGPSADNHS